jgi:transcriptional regulator with XRE-family HTH domain
MSYLCAEQIKAARAYLDWSRSQLARATGLSSNTIRNLELGSISPRGRTTLIIRQALEDAGLEFTENEGIRKQCPDIRKIEGADSCDEFFDDVIQTVKRSGGVIGAIFKVQEDMIKALGVTKDNSHDRLADLCNYATIRCILSEPKGASLALPKCQFMAVPKHHGSAVPYFVYGNKHAMVLHDGRASFKYVVFNSVDIARNYKESFDLLWKEVGSPLQMSPTSGK